MEEENECVIEEELETISRCTPKEEYCMDLIGLTHTPTSHSKSQPYVPYGNRFRSGDSEKTYSSGRSGAHPVCREHSRQYPHQKRECK
jgi:hypothetical protein